MEPDFPVEFLVFGTPVSFRTKRKEAKLEWQTRVKEASLRVLPEGHWAATGKIAATLFYFPDEDMEGDVDNIVKPILDVFTKHIYMDDHQVERVVVQKFERGNIFEFSSPSIVLQDAIRQNKPLLYVRLTDNPFEELI